MRFPSVVKSSLNFRNMRQNNRRKPHGQSWHKRGVKTYVESETMEFQTVDQEIVQQKYDQFSWLAWFLAFVHLSHKF